MATWGWVLLAVVVVIVIVLVALAVTKRRTAMLRRRFGPEYDRTVAARDDRSSAEAELRAREKQRAQIDIKPLPEATRLRFAGEWRDVQERFVDQPAEAVAAADTLIVGVMEARGYPMSDFEAQAALVSVDHPGVVESYRFAHGVRQRSQAQQTDTEDLREALLRYRSLFDELLRPDGTGPKVSAASQDGRTLPDATPGATTAAPDSAELNAGDPRSNDQPMQRGGR